MIVRHLPRKATAAAILLMGMFMAASLHAQTTLYWDTNGNTAGAGTSNGTWTTNNGASNRRWSTSSAGTANTQSWTSGAYAVFSAGTDNTGSFTVTVSGTQNVGGITVEEGNPTITSGILNFNSSSPYVNVASGSTITFNSRLSGSSGLAKNGAGTMILNSTSNNWTGAFTINAGTVQLNTSNVIPDASAVTVASGATLLLDWGVSETLGSLAGAGTVNFRTGTLTVGDSSNTTFSGVLQDSYGTLVKQGSGTLTLSGNNTYSGLTTINAGTLVAASDTALGGSTWGNTIASGATLGLQGGINLTEGQFNVTGTGAGGSGAIRNLSGSNTLNAALDLGGNTTITSDAGTLTTTGQINLGSNTLTVTGAGTTALNGQITNTGALTMAGSGTLSLGGTSANSFGGALNINSGTVLLNKTAGTNAVAGSAINIGDGVGAASSAVLRLGASNQIADYTGLITIASDGLLDLNGFSEGVDRIGGTGRIDLGTSGALTVGVNSGSSTFGGSLLGTGSFTKTGSGTLDITTDLTFNGTFTLAAGTLRLSDITLSLDTLNVTGNSIIDFGGVNAALYVTNLNISSGVTLTIQNWTNAADFFVAQNWSGAAFNVTGTSPMNQVVFTGFTANDTKWQAYDSQITPVPEPRTYGALLLLTGLGLVWWRRGGIRRIGRSG
jgi:autotransporter-associated beta strand protein